MHHHVNTQGAHAQHQPIFAALHKFEQLSQYPAIYQNFENNVYEGLQEGLTFIKKYNKLVLMFDENSQPVGILKGFTAFCNAFELSYIVLPSLKECIPRKGEVYVILDDKNLIRIIKKIKEESLEIAKDVGIISYNDTLLKEVVADGITAISTDFSFILFSVLYFIFLYLGR